MFRPFLTRVRRSGTTSGRVVWWFGTHTDITERKRAEEALQEADRRKDEFLATLAHELRNPLAPIRNALQILRLSADRQAQEQARAMMERQVDQMVRLVDDLLDVAASPRARSSSARSGCDLRGGRRAAPSRPAGR